jgi:hypothetical protein
MTGSSSAKLAAVAFMALKAPTRKVVTQQPNPTARACPSGSITCRYMHQVKSALQPIERECHQCVMSLVFSMQLVVDISSTAVKNTYMAYLAILMVL